MTTNDGRRTGSRKQGLNPFGVKAVEMYKMMFAKAASPGVSVFSIAKALDASPSTLETYCRESRPEVMPFSLLFEMVAREDVIPQVARTWFVREFARQCGFVAVETPDIGGDVETIERELIQAVRQLGEFAGRLDDAREKGSAAGQKFSRDEMDGMLESAQNLGVQVAELAQAIKERTPD